MKLIFTTIHKKYDIMFTDYKCCKIFLVTQRCTTSLHCYGKTISLLFWCGRKFGTKWIRAKWTLFVCTYAESFPNKFDFHTWHRFEGIVFSICEFVIDCFIIPCDRFEWTCCDFFIRYTRTFLWCWCLWTCLWFPFWRSNNYFTW